MPWAWIGKSSRWFFPPSFQIGTLLVLLGTFSIIVAPFLAESIKSFLWPFTDNQMCDTCEFPASLHTVGLKTPLFWCNFFSFWFRVQVPISPHFSPENIWSTALSFKLLIYYGLLRPFISFYRKKLRNFGLIGGYEKVGDFSAAALVVIRHAWPFFCQLSRVVSRHVVKFCGHLLEHSPWVIGAGVKNAF